MNSIVHIPHKIGSEKEFVSVCAELVRQGILFEAEDKGDEYIIELKGY